MGRGTVVDIIGILDLIKEGKSFNEIINIMEISPSTVNRYAKYASIKFWDEYSLDGKISLESLFNEGYDYETVAAMLCIEPYIAYGYSICFSRDSNAVRRVQFNKATPIKIAVENWCRRNCLVELSDTLVNDVIDAISLILSSDKAISEPMLLDAAKDYICMHWGVAKTDTVVRKQLARVLAVFCSRTSGKHFMENCETVELGFIRIYDGVGIVLFKPNGSLLYK
jgi:hypothetical protein